jgi:hypothetical protein
MFVPVHVFNVFEKNKKVGFNMKAKAETQVKSKSEKRTRGYRLKPSTHALIIRIQELMKSDQDEAIAAACTMLHAELEKNISEK